MSYNGKNYAEQGGDKWVIGGTLEIKEGASVTGLPAAEVPQAANQADSVATDVPTLVSDFILCRIHIITEFIRHYPQIFFS